MNRQLSSLPRLMLLTQSSLMQPDFLKALEEALLSGARLIQLREKEIHRPKVLLLAREAKQLCERFGAHLLINGDYKIAGETEAAGVHLRESQSVEQARNFLGEKYLIGQSTHSLEAALNAERSGADYLVFGSVFATQTHPGDRPVGVNALQEIAAAVSIPVYAIGGITSRNAPECVSVGAYGVAVIRAIWQAPQIAVSLSEFKQALPALEY